MPVIKYVFTQNIKHEIDLSEKARTFSKFVINQEGLPLNEKTKNIAHNIFFPIADENWITASSIKPDKKLIIYISYLEKIFNREIKSNIVKKAINLFSENNSLFKPNDVYIVFEKIQNGDFFVGGFEISHELMKKIFG